MVPRRWTFEVSGLDDRVPRPINQLPPQGPGKRGPDAAITRLTLSERKAQRKIMVGVPRLDGGPLIHGISLYEGLSLCRTRNSVSMWTFIAQAAQHN